MRIELPGPADRRLLWQIAKTDGLSFFLNLGAIFYAAFAAFDGIVGTHAPDRIPRDVAVVLALLSVGLGRIISIHRVLRLGTRLMGRLERLWLFKDRAWLTYSYEAGGRTLRGRQFVIQTARIRSLVEGATVELVVLPSNARRAYVSTIFED